MTSRIKALIAQMGLSTRAFALNCGLRQNTLSNQLNGIRELSLSTVSAILAAYPEISTDWLMRGEGEMLKKSNGVDAIETKNSERLLKMVDTIATLQGAINDKDDTIAALNERIRQLENQITK